MITLLGDVLGGLVLLGLAWLINRFGSPLAVARGAVRAVFPSRFSEDVHQRVARFQDKSLAAVIGLLGVFFIVAGVVNFLVSPGS